MQPESETEQPKATPKSLEKSPRRTQNGAIAQLVEQWTENPCVPGSNPGGTTKTGHRIYSLFGFSFVSRVTDVLFFQIENQNPVKKQFLD